MNPLGALAVSAKLGQHTGQLVVTGLYQESTSS